MRGESRDERRDEREREEVAGDGKEAAELTAHRHREGRAAVHVIVREPARQRVARRVEEDRAQRRQRVGVPREILGDGEADRPRQQLLHLATPVRAEPAVGLELAAELAEGI